MQRLSLACQSPPPGPVAAVTLAVVPEVSCLLTLWATALPEGVSLPSKLIMWRTEGQQQEPVPHQDQTQKVPTRCVCEREGGVRVAGRREGRSDRPLSSVRPLISLPPWCRPGASPALLTPMRVLAGTTPLPPGLSPASKSTNPAVPSSCPRGMLCRPGETTGLEEPDSGTPSSSSEREMETLHCSLCEASVKSWAQTSVAQGTSPAGSHTVLLIGSN